MHSTLARVCICILRESLLVVHVRMYLGLGFGGHFAALHTTSKLIIIINKLLARTLYVEA